LHRESGPRDIGKGHDAMSIAKKDWQLRDYFRQEFRCCVMGKHALEPRMGPFPQSRTGHHLETKIVTGGVSKGIVVLDL